MLPVSAKANTRHGDLEWTVAPPVCVSVMPKIVLLRQMFWSYAGVVQIQTSCGPRSRAFDWRVLTI